MIMSRKYSRPVRGVLGLIGGLLFCGVVGLIAAHSTIGTPKAHATPTTWYISKNGNNSGGTSWASAWNELDQINWTQIHPGDTIQIDGGNAGMTYTTHMSVGASGSSGSPITVERAPDAGHTGTVVFFGGNSALPPYCGQTATWTESPGAIGDAIDMNGNSWLDFEGGGWDGIQIHGYVFKTVNFGGGESNITMRNFEIYDNGVGELSGGTWSPDFPAVELAGVTTNLIFDHVDFHDNGQDNFQGSGGVNNFTVTNSWLHETRTIPGVPSEAFNLCSHNDGFQIFGSTASDGITFTDDILGPGLTNGVIFQPQVTHLTLQNVLILDPGSNATITNSGSSANWTLDHDTIIGQSDNVTLEGSGNVITNSILYDGLLLLNNSLSSTSNNCTFGTTASQGTVNGQNVDPQFQTDLSSYPHQTTDITQFPALSVLQNGDFSLKAGSPCGGLGSSITSVASFLSAIDSTAPSVPSGLRATATTSSNISLSWSAATDSGSGLAGYKLYRNSVQVANISAGTTSYTDSGLSPGTSYTYTISAYDNAGNQSAQSTSIQATTTSAAVPGDCNGDSHVTIIDLSLLLSHYGTAYAPCDFHADGFVSITDLSILLSNYGT